MLLTLADGADIAVAQAALRRFTTGSIIPNGDSRLLDLPVAPIDGLATEVLRALDAAGIAVRDISVRSASLDDVFLTLTGHAAEETRIEEKAEVAV